MVSDMHGGDDVIYKAALRTTAKMRSIETILYGRVAIFFLSVRVLLDFFSVLYCRSGRPSRGGVYVLLHVAANVTVREFTILLVERRWVLFNFSQSL